MVGIRAAADLAEASTLLRNSSRWAITPSTYASESCADINRSERRTRSSRSPRGVIIQIGTDEFLVAGIGMVVTFGTNGERILLQGLRLSGKEAS